MNIFFFIQDISLTGGTERVCQNLSSLFASKGHHVAIVSYNRGRESETYKFDSNVEIIYLSDKEYPINEGLFARFRSIIKSVRTIKILFKEKNINSGDILISQNFFSNMILWLAGKSSNTIGCEHFKYNLYSKPIRAIRCFIYSHFKKIVTLTDNDKNRFAKHLSNNILCTIPNMVVVKDDINIDINSKIIIAVGRLHTQKGFDMLIKAMKPVIKKHPDWILNIFGEGELKENLNTQINEYDLSSNVFLKGYTNDINSEFAKSAFFVLSSRYEGFPMVLVEALGLGVPSVAFDCPEGPSELLENGGGLLVEKENITKLTEAIDYMIEHPEYRRKCMNHKDYIRRNLSPDVIYNKWEKLFSNAE